MHGFHAIGRKDEHRSGFAVRSIFNNQSQANIYANSSNRIEKGFLGTHSDIGGGYESGDLSNASLIWMIKQAKDKGGIQFNNYDKYKQINNPIVHDNVWQPMLAFTMAGQFKWASDSAKGLDKSSIFNNFEHLGLNWNDTKAFQNQNHKQFDRVESLTKKYLKDPIANYAIYPGMVLDPIIYKRHNEYANLKGGSLIRAEEVLISGVDKNKVIALYDYLNMNTKRKEEDFVSNLTEKQLCSSKPLQFYLPIETKKTRG